MTEIENDNIIKTMKLHIKVAKDDVQKLIDVTTVYAEACTYISEYIFNNGFELGFIYKSTENPIRRNNNIPCYVVGWGGMCFDEVKLFLTFTFAFV